MEEEEWKDQEVIFAQDRRLTFLLRQQTFVPNYRILRQQTPHPKRVFDFGNLWTQPDNGYLSSISSDRSTSETNNFLLDSPPALQAFPPWSGS